jgi:hypothetical protein
MAYGIANKGGSLMVLQLRLQPRKESTCGDETVVHLTGYKVSLDEETLYRIHRELLAFANEPSESGLPLLASLLFPPGCCPTPGAADNGNTNPDIDLRCIAKVIRRTPRSGRGTPA